MFLVQLLLPMHHNDGTPVPAAEFAAVRLELTDRFGGVTAYSRAPATGLWKNTDDDVEHDQVIMVEVVVEVFDRDWWAEYRATLEHRFGQDEIPRPRPSHGTDLAERINHFCRATQCLSANCEEPFLRNGPRGMIEHKLH